MFKCNYLTGDVTLGRNLATASLFHDVILEKIKPILKGQGSDQQNRVFMVSDAREQELPAGFCPNFSSLA